MGLVATGLVLICWRLLRGKTAVWLINTNSAAVLLVAASVVDLGELAAAWNVGHSREAGGSGNLPGGHRARNSATAFAGPATRP